MDKETTPMLERHVVVRLWRLHGMMKSARSPSMKDLMGSMEVSQRTVERDIEILRDFFHAPIVFDRQKGGYRYADPSYCLDAPALRLSEGEFVALFMAHRLMSDVSGYPGYQTCQRAMKKLASLLPSAVPERAEQVEQMVSFHIPPLRGDPSNLERSCANICRAIQERSRVLIRYYSASRERESLRLLDPYHLRYVQAAWYLVGYCHTRKEVRIFAVDRILDLTMTHETFKIPEGFSLDEYLGKVWRIERGERFKASVKFTSDVARYVRERKWHESQQLSEEEGSLIARFEVDGWGEFKRWVMSFGSAATVLEPVEMAREIRAEASKMKESYDSLCDVSTTV